MHSYRQRILLKIQDGKLLKLSDELAKTHKDENDQFSQYGVLLLAVVLKDKPESKQSEIFNLFKEYMKKFKIEQGNQPLLDLLEN